MGTKRRRCPGGPDCLPRTPDEVPPESPTRTAKRHRKNDLLKRPGKGWSTNRKLFGNTPLTAARHQWERRVRTRTCTCAHTRWLLWGRPRCSHHTHSRPLPPPVASVEPCSDLTVLPVCHVQLTPSPPFGRRRRSEQGARPPSPARSSSGLRPRGAIRAHLAGGLGAEREVLSDTQRRGGAEKAGRSHTAAGNANRHSHSGDTSATSSKS